MIFAHVKSTLKEIKVYEINADFSSRIDFIVLMLDLLIQKQPLEVFYK